MVWPQLGLGWSSLHLLDQISSILDGGDVLSSTFSYRNVKLFFQSHHDFNLFKFRHIRTYVRLILVYLLSCKIYNWKNSARIWGLTVSRESAPNSENLVFGVTVVSSIESCFAIVHCTICRVSGWAFSQ